MHKTILFCLLLISAAHAETFVSTDVPVPIPDSPGGPARSYLTIPIDRVILDLNITFTITHTWDGDLGIYLEAPNGDDVQLIFRCGGSQNSGDNFVNTRLDDEASTYVCDANPPYTGTFRPLHPLYALDGLGTLGQWEFRVTDFASGDVGTIQAWQLEFVLGDTLTPVTPYPDVTPIPAQLALTAYPNPFNPAATLVFTLAQPQPVKLIVYDAVGQEVTVLADQFYSAGEQRMVFDAARLPAGIYFARLSTPTGTATRKLLLVK